MTIKLISSNYIVHMNVNLYFVSAGDHHYDGGGSKSSFDVGENPAYDSAAEIIIMIAVVIMMSESS